MFRRSYNSLIWISIIFSIINQEIYSLKIKIEALKLIKQNKKSETERLIEHLIMYGPHNLLAELLNLQTLDYKTITYSKCLDMTSSTVLDIIEEYEEGLLNFDQFKTVLSADCAARWTSDLMNDLTKLRLIPRIPVNFLESKDLNANRMYPETFLNYLNQAWNSEDREKIIWNRWTSKLGFTQAEKLYNNQLWDSSVSGFSPHLWQSINFRNFAQIRESDIMVRIFLANFVGLKMKNLISRSLEELIQRFYVLISFIKITEIDYANCVALNNDSMAKEFLKRLVSDLVKLVLRIHKRIRELDENSYLRMKSILDFTLTTSKESVCEQVNRYFVEFMKDSENVQLGDWLLGIICILSDEIELISFENINKFLIRFFSLRPSSDSVVFVYKFLRRNWRCPVHIEYIFHKLLKDKPKYLIEFYKTSRQNMPQKLKFLVPLRLRFIENLKNRVASIPGGIKVLEFDLLIDPSATFLNRFMEMVTVIAWHKLSINNPAIYKTSEDDFETISVQEILTNYFELFLGQREFYEIIEEKINSRPIIRILPVFPSELWHQFGHLLNRAVLLNVRIPFILDFEFFRGLFEDKNDIITEMATKIKSSADKDLGELYGFLTENVTLTPINLTEKLSEFSSKLEELRQSKTRNSVDSAEADRSVYYQNINSVDTTTIPFSEITHVLELLKYGFNSFQEGFKTGFNIEDFTPEDAHKIIFYRK